MQVLIITEEREREYSGLITDVADPRFHEVIHFQDRRPLPFGTFQEIATS